MSPTTADHRLPPDSTLLPISSGALLVSRSHATFCPVFVDDLDSVRGVLDGATSVATLPPVVLEALTSHGFFDAPRPPEPEAPSVQLQLTNDCNLACAYCCTNSGKPRAQEITFDESVGVLDQAREVLGAGTRIALLGGEPLSVPWCVRLGHEAIDRGFHLTLFTNGTLLPAPEQAEAVAGLMKRGTDVRVSLAGPSEGTCDALSGSRRYDAAVAGIRALSRLGCPPAVDLMLMPETVGAVVHDMRRLRRALGDEPRIALGLLYDSGREHGDRLFASRDELEEALNRVAFEGGCAIAAAARKPVTWRREGCSCALGHHLHVRSDGALFSCFRMEEQAGHLRTEGFGHVLERVRGTPHRAGDQPICRDCSLATLCGAGCRSESYRLTGDPAEPPCGPWRVRVLCELLAEGRVNAVDWPVHHLLAEAHRRRIEAPESIDAARPSRHLLDVA